MLLEKLSQNRCLIIDLRDNPGVCSQTRLKLADMLLDGGVIVSTAGRSGRAVDTASGNPISHQPIAFWLTMKAQRQWNLAGALKGQPTATIIGTHTYGRWLVKESITYLVEQQFTSRIRYLTPSGTDINRSVLHIQWPTRNNKKCRKSIHSRKNR